MQAAAIPRWKTHYDFADIESFDPDGKGYLGRKANDNCDYEGGNWALEWQAANPGKWYPCSAAHSQPLNGNRKACAAWHLFARLAGWKQSREVCAPAGDGCPHPAVEIFRRTITSISQDMP